MQAAERTLQTNRAAAMASLAAAPATPHEAEPAAEAAPAPPKDHNQVDKGKPKLQGEQVNAFSFNVMIRENNKGIEQGQSGHIPESGGLTHVVTHHESHQAEDNGQVKGDFTNRTHVDGQQARAQTFQDGQTISVVTAGDDDAARAHGLAEASNVRVSHIESTTTATQSESARGSESHVSSDVTSDSESTFSHYETRAFTPESVKGKTAQDLGLSQQEFNAVKQLTDQGHPATLTHATVAAQTQPARP
jgi:hypothetical protein